MPLTSVTRTRTEERQVFWMVSGSGEFDEVRV